MFAGVLVWVRKESMKTEQDRAPDYNEDGERETGMSHGPDFPDLTQRQNRPRTLHWELLPKC